MCRENFPTVIHPTCNPPHVLCQDGCDGTAAVVFAISGARRWGPSLPGGVSARAELPRGNLTQARRGATAVRRADG